MQTEEILSHAADDASTTLTADGIDWELPESPWPSAGIAGDGPLSEAALAERIVDLTIERDIYCQLAHQAIHALRDLTVERDRLRQRLRETRRQRS